MSRYLLALGIIICAVVSADAASLFGKVIDVSSGDVITIYNLNRPVRVKLMGVAAPELNQAFGDVAKKHLVDLVFEKSVVVEYAGIASDGSLTGRVLLNDADVGAQMIRDGAAWFDLRSGDRLNATNKEVYQQSEQAARNEKRGLWQQENPVAPWEFARAQAMQRNAASSVKENVRETKPRRSGSVPELTNLMLMGRSANGSSQSIFDANPAWVRSTARKNWSRFRPPDTDFSAEMPEDGEQGTIPGDVGDQMAEMKVYIVRDGWAIYGVAWLKGPTVGETDDQAIKGFSKKFMRRAAEEYEHGKTQVEFDCKPVSQKNISQNGYTGVEFDVTACSVPTRVRIYTRLVDNKRELYMGLVVFSQDESENVSRFLKSFSVGTASKRTR